MIRVALILAAVALAASAHLRAHDVSTTPITWNAFNQSTMHLPPVA